TPETVTVQGASIAFDAATFEIWGALCHGARLVLLPAKALDLLPEALTRHGVDTLWLTTQLFHLMVDQHLESLAGVKQVVTGGEIMSLAHARRYLARYEGVNELIHVYGPTEGTTFSTFAPLTRAGLTPWSAP